MIYPDLIKNEEIEFLKIMIDEIVYEYIEDYHFDEFEIRELIKKYGFKNQIIDELCINNIIHEIREKKCSICCQKGNNCNCEVANIVNKKYYKINQKKFIELFKGNFEKLYNYKLILKDKNKNYNEYQLKDINIKLYLYKSSIDEKLTEKIKGENNIIVSIKSLDNNSNILEWYDFIDKENYSEVNKKIDDLIKNNKNKEFYYLNLGDDLTVIEIETIKDVLIKFLTIHKFKKYTQEGKYKPEYLDYKINLDYIKACFIKETFKILILKPSENQIAIALFNNQLMGYDKYLVKLIDEFEKFAQKKAKKNRKIKMLENKSNKNQKIIQLIGPVMNILVIILGLVSTKEMFSEIKKYLVQHYKSFLYIYGLANILSLVFILYNFIYPIFLRVLFNWYRGVRLIKFKIVAKRIIKSIFKKNSK